jgi:drug/metabolite transporter (DMT)-like permease
MSTAATRDDRSVRATGIADSVTRAPRRTRTWGGAGIGIAVLSAASFGTSGTFGTSLLRSGWSPGAAVLVRITVAALILTGPALARLRGRWTLLRRQPRLVVGYGLIGVVGCQLCYFNAIERMPVGVALLLEYLGAVLVVAWLWLRHGQRPRWLTVGGAAAAMGGLAMMVGVTGSGGISPVGVMWGLLAAVSMAVYFVLSAGPAKTDHGAAPGEGTGAYAPEPLPPIVLAWAGMCVGAVALGLLGLAHVVPLAASAGDVTLLGHQVSWVLPVIGIALFATAIGYSTGIAAVRLLGAKLGSFIGMAEILFAALFAWLLLGQLPTVTQFLGGALILVGVALVRIDES